MVHQILVVEDNADSMALMEWILEDAGFDMTGVETGEECLEAVNSTKIDAILMDISLPGIDGKETTRRVRAIKKFSTLPIIAVTCQPVKDEEESIWKSGVDDLLTKPIDEKKLVARLNELIHK
ncbi:MAG: response regulator [Pseudomonadales bacterium]|nr:response regulator [Pseudomonadales bacterium]